MGDPMTPIEPNTNPALLVAQVHRWRTAFLGVVVLLAGVAIGIGAALIWAGHRMPVRLGAGSRPPIVNEQRFEGARLIVTLRDFLRLSDQQVHDITPIIREHMANIQRIRKEVRPKVAEELRSMDKRITEELNKDQRRKWERRFRLLQEQLQWQIPPYRGRPQDFKGPMLSQGRPGESRIPTPPNQPDNQ
jgi:hypothetical protein